MSSGILCELGDVGLDALVSIEFASPYFVLVFSFFLSYLGFWL